MLSKFTQGSNKKLNTLCTGIKPQSLGSRSFSRLRTPGLSFLISIEISLDWKIFRSPSSSDRLWDCDKMPSKEPDKHVEDWGNAQFEEEPAILPQLHPPLPSPPHTRSWAPQLLIPKVPIPGLISIGYPYLSCRSETTGSMESTTSAFWEV